LQNIELALRNNNIKRLLEESMRKIINFNTKWAFSKEAAKVPKSLPDNWIWVNLPHTWNDIDGMDGGNDYYRGTCYYAKTVDKTEFLPEAEKYFIEIQGANSSADLYINGKKLAHHDGGYSTWRVDVTEEFMEEEKPLVVVAVDNAPNQTVYPQKADFTFYGGLYRDINIICTDKTHFDLEYYGGPGMKVTPLVENTSANVKIEVFVKNAGMGQRLIYAVKDLSGKIVIRKETPVTDTEVNMEINHVHLWNAVKDPYLYTAEVKLLEGETEIDSISLRFGCRTFRIDPEKGFFLNGKSFPLHGVSRHQDRIGKGNAISKEDHMEDMKLICEMGANTIRLAHYQHDQFFYDLCDEKGMIVWAEIPYISAHMPSARDNTISQMKELVVQNYHHPSIVVWGLSNEITMQGNSDADLLENHKMLNDLCHEMDATRLTTIACVSTTSIDDPYITIPDVVSYNHYFGWYGGDTSMNGSWMDAFHKRHPSIPVGMSEYGCEALNWHTSDPQQGDYTEEYQAYYHEELIKQLFTRDYIWATHVWNMFDFGADARGEGGENGQNHKGLVTIDRKYKKDAFYAYKAWLSTEPFVHVAGKRYVDRVEPITRVTVYSNQPEVELFVNGKSIGKKKSEEHFFYFDTPNQGESAIRAVAGQCVDESIIRKVDKFNEIYRLVDKGAVLNWFDITEADGCLSLNSKVKEVLAVQEGKSLFNTLLENKQKSTTFEINESMMQIAGELTVLRLCNMLGGMNIELTKEQLLTLNVKLNQIKKADGQKQG